MRNQQRDVASLISQNLLSQIGANPDGIIQTQSNLDPSGNLQLVYQFSPFNHSSNGAESFPSIINRNIIQFNNDDSTGSTNTD